jgi:hypothetical protein
MSNDQSPPDTSLESLDYIPFSMTVDRRPEGYREFRVQAGTWWWSRGRPIEQLTIESMSGQVDSDPRGYSLYAEYWSGNDAAVRMQHLPASDLALRELAILATRRNFGLNNGGPWLSGREVIRASAGWSRLPRDGHWWYQALARPVEPTSRTLWSVGGLDESTVQGAVTGYYTMPGRRRLRGDQIKPWHGAPGTWYPWSKLATWKQWPRRQDAERWAVGATRGRLLLFISHRWEALDHSDPTGAQLLALLCGLTMSLAAALLPRPEGHGANEFSRSGLPEIMRSFLAANRRILGGAPPDALQIWAHGVREAAQACTGEAALLEMVERLANPAVQSLLDRVRAHVIVWYDYASMYQQPRSTDEESRFQTEILQLNDIQRNAATVVLAGGSEYLSRAWCFLELCGALRGRLAEITPSWATSIDLVHQPWLWTRRSDQLIGALNLLGLQAIQGAGLSVTHAEDLPSIARLMSRLPLLGQLQSEESDLVGGTLPVPFVNGHWVRASGGAETVRASRTYHVGDGLDTGLLPDAWEDGQRSAAADRVATTVGIWVYTPQKTMSLAWAAQANQWRRWLGRQLLKRKTAADVAKTLDAEAPADVACMWADGLALDDDGKGWTRPIPCAARTLLIIVPDDLAAACLILDKVLRAHLAIAATVIVFSPDAGSVSLYRPTTKHRLMPKISVMDVLAVPRTRRCDAPPRRMFLPPEISEEAVETMAALRLDPCDRWPQPGQVHPEVASVNGDEAGRTISLAEMRSYSDRRARIEGMTRSALASWDNWCSPRLTADQWFWGIAPLQLEVIEQMGRVAREFFENPYKCRRLTEMTIDGEGYLPKSLPGDMRELARRMRDDPDE